MALIKCSYCEKTISSMAKQCPHCKAEVNLNVSKSVNRSPNAAGEKQKNLFTVKICPFCGEKINYKAIKCKFCNEFLNNQSSATASQDLSETRIIIINNLKNQNVLNMIVLTIITLGIYPGFYFLNRYESFNKLNTKYKFSATPFYFYILLSVIDPFVGFSLTPLLGIIILFSSIKIWQIFTELNIMKGTASEGLGFLFLNIFYTQHKINRL